MANYSIMYWKDIPNVVRVWDENGEHKQQLSMRFALAIDAAAVADAAVEADAYLDGWRWSDPAERPGPAKEVMQALVQELEAAWPRQRLAERARGNLESEA